MELLLLLFLFWLSGLDVRHRGKEMLVQENSETEGLNKSLTTTTIEAIDVSCLYFTKL